VSPDDHLATVVVVARGATYAARLELTLRRLEGWHVEVSTPARFPELARRYPDAILVLAMGEAETRRLLRGLRDGGGRRVVVTLSEQPARQWSSAWRSLGVRAALPSTATPDEVASAVRAVHAGLLVVHPDAVTPPAPVAGVPAPRLAMTSREREILELIAEGANNRVIAARLAISRHTVKFHVASLMAKLGARSRTEAVALALRAGLLAV
jgi:two-component system, NarL family, response regulator YdfI